MRSFEYYSPTRIVFGDGRHEEVGSIIKRQGVQKVLLHYGQGSVKKTGVYDAVVKSLRDEGILWIELGGVQPNPKLSLALQGAALCREHQVEMVLAVGGGSVVDSAKLICTVAQDKETDPWKYFTKEAVPQKALPLGVVLTIAAAGSEMSASCVITHDELRLKRGMTCDSNRPLFAVMNPTLTFTVSPFQTACGVVDILMHTIERYFQPDRDAELTHSLGEALMCQVVEAGRIVMKQPEHYEARATLMWAGSLSHNDLTGAGKTPGLSVHQLEHEISGAYDHVAHAAGLSVLFPAWAEYVCSYDTMKFCRFAVNVWGCRMDYENPEKTAREGIRRVREYFCATLGLPVTLGELGIGEERLEEMAAKCTFYGKRTIPGVRQLDQNDIVAIFRSAL
jgi:alcohol dehydrogenase